MASNVNFPLAAACSPALLAVIVAGCAHAPTPVAVPARSEGQGRYEFVRPPAPPDEGKAAVSVEKANIDDQYVAPRPIGDLPEPVYPAAALAANEGPVSIGMRLVVDTEGRVTDISPSMLTLSLPSRFSAEFRAAIETAVAAWRFRPAEIRHFTAVTNKDGTYRSLTGTEKTEWALHVVFRFNITGAVPMTTVNSSARK